MKDNSEFSNGLRNINDALFIRANFIPPAIASKKWSLVVSEAHRIIELLLGGLIYLVGGDPLQKKHNLEGLVQKFEHYLIEMKGNLPFSVGYYSDSGDCYGVELRNNTIRVLQRINNLYAGMVSVQCQPEFLEKYAKIDLEVDDSGVLTLIINGEIKAKLPGVSIQNSHLVHIHRQFGIKPRSERFIELKKISQCFTHNLLLDARYSKREFAEIEALEVKEKMDLIFKISKNMVSVGK
ncbi:MAG: hypothetical protein Q7J20_05650 [Candidatus Nitrotoga sp.]|nr:hypothetical protein [Candidatus Nitrotoga sp.]MDO9447371.1 hypothetical protein [Candidatus Nitrotoga sp.]